MGIIGLSMYRLAISEHIAVLLLLLIYLRLITVILDSLRYFGKFSFGYIFGRTKNGFSHLVTVFTKQEIYPDKDFRTAYQLVPYFLTASGLALFFILPISDKMISGNGIILFVPFLLVLNLIYNPLISRGSFQLFSGIEAVRKNYQSYATILNVLLAIVSVIITAGSSDLYGIVALQGNSLWESGLNFLCLRNPFIFVQMIIFFVSISQLFSLSPFGSDRIGGDVHCGEYFGLRMIWLNLGKNVLFLVMILVGIIIFWGGWKSPFEFMRLMNSESWDLFWLVVKAAVIIILLLITDYLFSNISLKQTLYLQWKFLLPLSIICGILNILWGFFIVGE